MYVGCMFVTVPIYVLLLMGLPETMYDTYVSKSSQLL